MDWSRFFFHFLYGLFYWSYWGGFVINWRCFLVSLSKLESEARQRIELPIGIIGFLGVVFVRQYVTVYFDVELCTIAQSQVGTQAYTACYIYLVVTPKVLQLVSCIVQGYGFIVVESAINAYSGKEVSVKHTLVVIATEQSAKVECSVYITL